jgi:hypothetical protein
VSGDAEASDFLTVVSPDVTRPLLLLDVDGVLCPLGSRGGEELHEAMLDFMPVLYSPQTPERLRLLTDRFDLVWATSWEDKANDSLAPLFGLPPLPVVRLDEPFAVGETWKLPSIKRYVGERPFAWLDDEIGHDAQRWARERSAPTLLHEIAADCGLGASDVEALLDFARLASQ